MFFGEKNLLFSWRIYYATFQCGRYNIFKIFFKFFAPQNMKKTSSKGSHNWPPFFFSIANWPKTSPNHIFCSKKWLQMSALLFLVGTMPSLYPYIKAMPGARAVPTPSMDGVIFIFGSDFWELTFKNSTSTWKIIRMTTPQMGIYRNAWPIVEYIDENLIDVTGLCT